MPMILPPGEIDSDLIDEFFNEFTERYERCEEILIALEHQPTNHELTNELFRAIHTIKGNLIYIGLKDLCPLLQSIEDILEQLRKGGLQYNDLLSDVVLLAMDRTKQLVEDNLQAKGDLALGAQFDQICQAITHITEVSEPERPSHMFDAVKLLDPSTKLNRPEANNTKKDKDNPKKDRLQKEAQRFGLKENEDLTFIHQLIPAIEERSHFWRGRTYRITQLCLEMNLAAGNPVDAEQLTMASFIHDMGMAFLPLELLHKETRFNSNDKRQMHTHVRMGHDVLHRMGDWEDAAEIVLQHHERCNGSGYPKGVTENEICDGAKILAIADTFDAFRYTRAYRTESKRPLVRAILEINRQSGEQLSEHWVNLFNQVAKKSFTIT